MVTSQSFVPLAGYSIFLTKRYCTRVDQCLGNTWLKYCLKKWKKSQLFFFILLVICNFSCHFFIKYVKKNVFLWVLWQTSSPTLRDYLTTRYDLPAWMNSKIFDAREAVSRGWVPTSVIALQGENWNSGPLKPPVLASDRYSDPILARNQHSALIGVACTFYFLRQSASKYIENFWFWHKKKTFPLKSIL